MTTEYGSIDLHQAAEFFRNIGKTVTIYEIKENDLMIGGVIVINNIITGLIVHWKYRNRGIGGSLIKIMQTTHNHLLLQCRKELLPYYNKFGFQIDKPTEVDPNSYITNQLYHMKWVKT